MDLVTSMLAVAVPQVKFVAVAVAVAGSDQIQWVGRQAGTQKCLGGPPPPRVGKKKPVSHENSTKKKNYSSSSKTSTG